MAGAQAAGFYASQPAAALAKAALRRLARDQMEPTPENYARAYALEAGQSAAAALAAATSANAVAVAVDASADSKLQGPLWATLIDRLCKGLARGSREWTAARRTESLQRVLDGSRSDAQRLQQRLQALLSAWDQSGAEVPALAAGEGDAGLAAAAVAGVAAVAAATAATTATTATTAAPRAPFDLSPVFAEFEKTVRAGLPPVDVRSEARNEAQQADLATELADELARLADALADHGTSTVNPANPATVTAIAAIAAICERVRRHFGHRHQLVDQLDKLCRELSQGLAEMSEDDSWVRGQAESLQARLADGPSARSVRAATELLADTRLRQGQVKRERQAAREALKGLLQGMLGEVADLGQNTGRFQLAVGRHAEAITQALNPSDNQADSLQSLSGVVQALLDDSRAVTAAVSLSQQRLDGDSARARQLEDRVRELEVDLRRLSEEVSTDALTQVANRRGLAQAFELESARCGRQAGAQAGVQADAQADSAAAACGLSVALIDIDNFKKLNDTLGHAAGDVALQALAAGVKKRLRPVDHLARFGGEEFVVLMPDTALDEAQAALSRLQRELSASLFMHDGKDVLITFSAGVTRWRTGEALEAALERADEALYEAKRTGKNRSCVA